MAVHITIFEIELPLFTVKKSSQGREKVIINDILLLRLVVSMISLTFLVDFMNNSPDDQREQSGRFEARYGKQWRKSLQEVLLHLHRELPLRLRYTYSVVLPAYFWRGLDWCRICGHLSTQHRNRCICIYTSSSCAGYFIEHSYIIGLHCVCFICCYESGTSNLLWIIFEGLSLCLHLLILTNVSSAISRRM